MAMKTELESYTNELIREVGDDAKSLFAGQIGQARAYGIPDQSLRVGAKAPLFSLPSATGEVIDLGRLLQDGPVVLVFYRGGWCPYCNIQLRSYQSILNTLKQMRSCLVAISPENPDHTVETKNREKLEFHVLSDTNNAVARQFGLVFPVSSDVLMIFKDRWNLDLKKENGVDGGELPVPGTYVIDRDHTVIFSRVDEDYRRRPEPEEILEALRSCRVSFPK
jgi:peroxiredoxin